MKVLLILTILLVKTGLADSGIPRIKLDLDKFEVIEPKPTGLQVKILKETLYWERSLGSLRPMVYLEIINQNNLNTKNLHYKNNDYSFIKNKALIKYSLFESDLIKFNNEIIYLQKKGAEKKHHIDYSCLKLKVQVLNIDDLPISINCRRFSYGPALKRQSYLEFILNIPHWSHGPLKITTDRNKEIKFNIFNNLTNKKREVKIAYRFSKRNHRLKTAIGFGPYELFMRNQEKLKKAITLPIMLYANFHLKGAHSIRMFNFFAYNKSYFNNAGFYYAYTQAEILDGLIKITPLLGFQSIEIHNHQTSNDLSDVIAPQGFEATYNHAFGVPNYLIGVGLFLSPENGTDYQNIWVRWGKGYFWELNFLSYRKEAQDFYTKSWGLSIGLPFFSLF